MGLVAAAAVGAVGAVGGGLIAAGGAKSAAKANQQAANTATAEQTAARDQAYATLSPFVNTGTQASGAINALLGLTPTNQPAATAQLATQNGAGIPDFSGNGFDNISGIAAYIKAKMANGGGGIVPNGQQPMQTMPQQASYLTPQQAFDNYRNSTGYQFRFNQGMKAINSGYAGAGTLQSGAALKAAQEYGQGLASAEFGNYLNSLGNQQAIGLQAGSAAAGVGTNAANSLGTIAMNNGANQANASLVRASALGQGISGAASAFGSLLSSNYAAGMPSAAQINTSALASLRGYG